MKTNHIVVIILTGIVVYLILYLITLPVTTYKSGDTINSTCKNVLYAESDGIDITESFNVDEAIVHDTRLIVHCPKTIFDPLFKFVIKKNLGQ